ncbi:CAP domain-containing protein [Arthrobacter sp. K5]|uniref:CAP domain-containing protein n=1 Tax=Arthrobacter sp. K5 TaxID=2839623 RepID=A0AAU8EWA3_9MICC
MNKSVMPRLASVLLAAGLISGGVAAPSQAAETDNAIDTQSRDAVVTAYKDRYLPAQAEDINWTGSVAGCDPGTQSASSLASGTAAINFFRGLSGLDGIVLTAEQNAKAQAAALMMHAQGRLDHYPTSDWECFTPLGQAGAGTSNLHYTYPRISSISDAIRGYMDDWGGNNVDVGHRRWLLNPATTTMGIGTTSMYNAINVIGGGTSATRANPDFIAFPNAGYFPTQLLPPGRWSLSSGHEVDFSRAGVVVTDAAGTDMKATAYAASKGYGPNTLVFTVPQLQFPRGTEETNYTVKVTGMVRDGMPIDYAYTVKLIDGTVTGPSTPDPTPPQVRENIAVTPVAPTFGGWYYTVPSTPGVRYLVGGIVRDPGTYFVQEVITITAEAKYGYVLQGTTSWSKDLRPVPIIEVEPAAPTFGASSFTIPSIVGVRYTVEGQPKAPGTYPASGRIDVYAEALPGYSVTGNLAWSHTFAPPVTPPSAPPATLPSAPPAAPSIKSQDSVLAIDATGNLWNYGNLKATRVKIGTGWGSFSDIHVADWNRDGYFDILGKTKAGQLYLYRALRGGGFSKETLGASGWQNYTIDVGTWKVADKFPSIVAKHIATGKLLHYANTSGAALRAGVQLGTGWQNLDISLFDWNRDGAMDIVARNAGGQMMLYRTNGKGSFITEKRPVIGAGWQGFTSLTVARGLGGIGTQGLLARTKSGALVYYQANRSAWAAPRTLSANGWAAYVIGSH